MNATLFMFSQSMQRPPCGKNSWRRQANGSDRYAELCFFARV